MARVRAAGRKRAPFPAAGVGYGQGDPNSFPSDGLAYDEKITFGSRSPIALSSLPNSGALTALADQLGAALATEAGLNCNVLPFVADLSSQQVLSANPRRQMLLVQNQSTTDNIYFQFGQSAAVNFGIKLGPGIGLMFDTKVPTNYVTVVANNVNVQGVVAEGM
jgi:hypothetical protein